MPESQPARAQQKFLLATALFRVRNVIFRPRIECDCDSLVHGQRNKHLGAHTPTDRQSEYISCRAFFKLL